MPPCERLDLFAVPVWQGMLEGFAEHREGLLGVVRGERDAGRRRDASNRGGFRSGDSLHEIDAPPMRYLTRAILEFGVRALRAHAGGFAETDLALTHTWANIDGASHWHTPHCHYPSQWSGVVYVDAGSFSSPDPGDRAGKIELLSPLPAPQAFGQPTGVTFTPKDGMILLFPGVLQHLVHPHAASGERVSVAFNLDVVAQRQAG